jgi:type I restriction enzyme S subunit
LRGAKATKQSKALSSRIYRENGVWYEQVGTATPKDISDEIPFEIPKNWAWCRVSQVMDVKGGKRIPLGNSWMKTVTKHIYIRVTDMKNGSIIDRDLRYISDDVYEKIKNYTISKNDLYITVAGTIGAVGVVPEKFDNMNLTENADKITNICIDKDFIVKCFNSPFVQSQFKALTNQMAQPKLSIRNVLTTLFPLPPLAEQKRIVAKLEQVLPLAEEYGAAQEQLDKLNKELPEALKKSILQEAIQGKLVEQNPKDEPAQKLLERITVARSESSQPKGAKSKKSTPTSRIYCENGTWYEQIGNATPKDISEDIPFDIPTNWVWCRVRNVISLLSGRDLEPSQYNASQLGIPYMTGASNFSNESLIVNRWTNSPVTVSHKGDLLITCKGTIGTMAFNDVGDVHIARQIMAINSSFMNLNYVKYFLTSYVNELQKVARSMIPGISRDDLLSSLIPIPPLAEQKRIVTKLEQLFKVL